MPIVKLKEIGTVIRYANWECRSAKPILIIQGWIGVLCKVHPKAAARSLDDFGFLAVLVHCVECDLIGGNLQQSDERILPFQEHVQNLEKASNSETSMNPVSCITRPGLYLPKTPGAKLASRINVSKSVSGAGMD